ncbi:MAG TPA: glutamine--fructose-6-phosphate aminotransferase, partial [Actinomycetota bacterium]
MCGIVGYVGPDEALPIVVEGLRRLEYRGYDSAGVAVLADGLTVRKRAGKLDVLVASLADEAAPVGTTAMGHTRWATHGPPTDRNAHPHVDCTGTLAVIHNGIVENHEELRTRLEKDGHAFASETDTEVVAHLIEEVLGAGGASLTDAVRDAVRQLRGAYSLVVLSADHPDEMVGVKVSSPLVVGLGAGETILASDIPAVLERTRTVVPLDEGQIATIRPEGLAVVDLDGAPVDVTPMTVDWDVVAAQKGGYD